MAAAAALAPFHILQESVVRERFEDERRGGIHVAFVRVFRIEPVWILPNEKSYGGCRSWVRVTGCHRRHCDFHPVVMMLPHDDLRERFLARCWRIESCAQPQRSSRSPRPESYGAVFFLMAFELHVVKTPVISRFFEQLGVRPDFLDSPFIHHHDLIGG